MRNWIPRIKGLFGSSEKSYVLQTNKLPWNWFQLNSANSQVDFGSFGPVYTCWAIIAQEVSRVPLMHVEIDNNIKRQVLNRAPARVLRQPNTYQTRSDFLLSVVRSLLAEGNFYAFCTRNNRFEVETLHPINPRACWPNLTEDGDVFYHVTDNESLRLARVGQQSWFPARDILHIRLFTPHHPLIGETPLVAALAPVYAGQQINGQVAKFFGNMARPSGIIRHPKQLKPEAARRLKEMFRQASSQERAGDPIVFQEGMEWQSLTMSAVDAELIASYKLTERQVAQIYRVPPHLLGEDAKFATVEQSTRFFLNSGLGFYLDHISDSLTKFFGLGMGEEILFDYETALLRSDLEARLKALAEGTRGGIYAVNEARAREGLPPVEYGDEPRMQQQMVPLSFGAQMQPNQAPEIPAPEPSPDEEDDGTGEEDRALRIEILRRRLAA
jgi:HK97 family phage portal protein